jgi:hypothetical protein
MLSHCANSQCGTAFLRLQQGKLFLVETDYASKSRTDEAFAPPHKRKPPRSTERYWLCDRCAQAWTLVQDKNRGIVLLPLVTPAARATLRGESKVTAS